MIATPTESGSPAPREPAAASPGHQTWAFWRKRLGRALIVAGFVLGIAQLVPSVPENQLIEVDAPRGWMLRKADLTYYPGDGGEALSGTQLVAPGPSARLTHKVRLADGLYKVVVKAEGEDPTGKVRLLKHTQILQVGVGVTHLHLSAP